MCVEFVCRWLSKCGWFLLEFDATLDAECGLLEHLPIKGSEGSPGLFQDFEHGYIKVEDFSSYSQGDPNSKSMDSQFSIVIF